ncbi:hypothetical protein Glove_155g120 [Diversispora epigaea]|uniref:Uncharacterized protein n=1 Tax=Diversispora epigaea TaxID=1348612 RepID=A0A397J1E1_9GLOM|nr:hypothetical protein Glove_155g120 [Diversispora epigaea]
MANYDSNQVTSMLFKGKWVIMFQTELVIINDSIVNQVQHNGDNGDNGDNGAVQMISHASSNIVSNKAAYRSYLMKSQEQQQAQKTQSTNKNHHLQFVNILSCENMKIVILKISMMVN